MNGECLNFENPIGDALSRVQFAPQSNNLLISSWDSVSTRLFYLFIYYSPSKLLHLFLCDLTVQKLRLYDVDSSLLRLEAPAPSQAALLDCCFQTECVAFTAASDGSIIRFVVVNTTWTLKVKPSFSFVVFPTFLSFFILIWINLCHC